MAGRVEEVYGELTTFAQAEVVCVGGAPLVCSRALGEIVTPLLPRELFLPSRPAWPELQSSVVRNARGRTWKAILFWQSAFSVCPPSTREGDCDDDEAIQMTENKDTDCGCA